MDLETNFVIVEDLCDEDFILGGNIHSNACCDFGFESTGDGHSELRTRTP